MGVVEISRSFCIPSTMSIKSVRYPGMWRRSRYMSMSHVPGRSVWLRHVRQRLIWVMIGLVGCTCCR